MADALPGFGLPEEVLAVLPADPFEQLDVARKITSIALASRVSTLEAEASRLRRELAEREEVVAELRAQVEELDASLGEMSQHLARADVEKESLRGENASLTSTVKKLNRDVSKSLQEDEENVHAGSTKVPKQIPNSGGLSSASLVGEAYGTIPSLKMSQVQSQLSETSSVSDDSGLVESDVTRQGASHVSLQASLSTPPRLTPPDSPTGHSTTGSPTRSSKQSSPRRYSITSGHTRNVFEERSTIFSSMPSGNHSSVTSPFDAGTHTGRSRVDGKEFFRQVRTRLSYEQFSAFLANVKELNSHKQTKEETLRKADEIFGADNRDLYAIFEGLISRNLH